LPGHTRDRGTEGQRVVIETAHTDRAWEVIVEPDESAKALVVVTAFALE